MTISRICLVMGHLLVDGIRKVKLKFLMREAKEIGTFLVYGFQ